jgi:response regulator of citrate/malate metabolism
MDKWIAVIRDNRTAKAMIDVFQRNEGCDFSLSELQKAVGVSWITAKKALDILKKSKTITESRRHGRAVLYKLRWDRSLK